MKANHAGCTMPMHDWTTVQAGTYHTFHQRWAGVIMDVLNFRLLPDGYHAMLERPIDGPMPDVISFHESEEGHSARNGSGLTTLARPKKAFVITAIDELVATAMNANRIVVRTKKKKVVAIIEIVSPGNKHGSKAIKQFVAKTVDFLSDRVNLLIIDPFPPGPRDPNGLHPLIWEQFDNASFTLPKRKPLTFASYQTVPQLRAYIEPIAVRSKLPDMPLFLKGDFYVDVPLEETYMETCKLIPADLRADYN